MRLLTHARLLLPAAVLMVALASGCGGGGTTGPSADKVRTTTASDVETVLRSMSVDVKGAITCFGQAPGIVDCKGTTSDGKDIQATLTASTSGLSCTGPMVVNVNKMQLASLPDEKCS
jgi:ABC-type glycerol-3-phosphate transport system substrate-binding protein